MSRKGSCRLANPDLAILNMYTPWQLSSNLSNLDSFTVYFTHTLATHFSIIPILAVYDYVAEAIEMLKRVERCVKREESYLKRCFVPNCKNNSSNTRKRFVRVPEAPEARKLWYEKVRTFKYSSGKEYCCEDHFDLKHDAENHESIARNSAGGELTLKKAVVPHKNLQLDVKTATKKKTTSRNGDHGGGDCDCCSYSYRKNQQSMVVTYCNDLMNFRDYFAESDDLSSDECSSNCEDFTTDLLLASSDKSYSNRSLNLHSVSEVNFGVSQLYSPRNHRGPFRDRFVE